MPVWVHCTGTFTRSLVSREIETLKKSGYVISEDIGGKRSYNARIKLTDSGVQLAERIKEVAVTVQEAAGVGISEEELVSFYSTLEKLYRNFSAINSGEKADSKAKPRRKTTKRPEKKL